MCGIVGIISNKPVNQKIFDALIMLQHRGQDAAGILTCDGQLMTLQKSNGLVVEAIHTRHMQRLTGNLGIGHVRYPTAGSDSATEAQPFYVNSPYGIALAHNGNLTNAKNLREELIFNDRRHLNTFSDSEILLNVFASNLDKQNITIKNLNSEHIFNAIAKTMLRVKGGYAVVGVIANLGLFAFRDPYGIRPLVIGKKTDKDNNVEYMISSETVSLDCDDYEIINDIAPSEGVFIDLKGNIHRKICDKNAILSPCIFELVYLARPDSVIDKICVYGARMNMGRKLGEQILDKNPNHDIDVVIPIPDSGRISAFPIAEVLGCDYREGFVKNRYIGRTFIMPSQEIRKKSIRKKLNAITKEFVGKHVLLVDDSIVRGNTSQMIVEMALQAGARKVSIALAAPKVLYPNVYGIDMPTHEELIAHNLTTEEMVKLLKVDNIYYQTLEDLILAVQEENHDIKQFDTSVFDGKYITGDIDESYFNTLKEKRIS